MASSLLSHSHAPWPALKRWRRWIPALFAAVLPQCNTAEHHEQKRGGSALDLAPAPATRATPSSPSAPPSPVAVAPTDWLPLAVGNAWTLVDSMGELEIRVARREPCGSHSCYVIEWHSGGMNYQSERWYVDSQGIWVAGRSMGPVTLSLSQPWQFLKSPLGVGSKWAASWSSSAGPIQRDTQLSIEAVAEDELDTPAGHFRALRVDFRDGNVSSYSRWYARGVGLVREDAFGGGQRRNSKLLSKVKLASKPAAAAPAIPPDPAASAPSSDVGTAATLAYMRNVTNGRVGLVSTFAVGPFLSDQEEVVLQVQAKGGGAQLVMMRKQGIDYQDYQPVLRTAAAPWFELGGQVPIQERRHALFVCALQTSHPVKRSRCGFLGRGTFADVAAPKVAKDVQDELTLVESSECGYQTQVRLDEVRGNSQLVVVTARLTQLMFKRRSAGSERCDSAKQLSARELRIEYQLNGLQPKRITPPLPELEQAIARYR